MFVIVIAGLLSGEYSVLTEEPNEEEEERPGNDDEQSNDATEWAETFQCPIVLSKCSNDVSDYNVRNKYR